MRERSLHLVSAKFPYPDAPDIESSSDEYAGRFSGNIGNWFLEVQTTALMSLLMSKPGLSILDVGGGHGQNIAALLKAGHNVTVLGSSPECSRRLVEFESNCNFKFLAGSVVKLPFESDSFDVVISFRLLSHLYNWQEEISELCRVARQQVIVDYPTKLSFNAIEPVLFRLKKQIEGNTRHFLTFSHSEIREAFAKSNFTDYQFISQFFWPMALHRATKNVGVARAIESIPAALGLTKLFGTPVIGSFKPKS
jgi:ubiquinone/menaquinone biosynthesis C-methylase UbiE